MGSDFDERLWVPVTWWVLAVALGVVVWWTFVLATPPVIAATAGFVSFTLTAAALWHWGSAHITVSDQRLRAGRAVIPLHLCAAATPLDAVEARALRGPLADARAYLLLRPYVPTGVRVDLADPQDPTPYWLLSSRRPDELARAVKRTGNLPASG